MKARGINLVKVIGAYLLRGVVPLRHRPLKLYEMVGARALFVGMITVNPLPTIDDVRRRVRIIVGNHQLVFPKEGVLPMLPSLETTVLVSLVFRSRLLVGQF